jgi:hypothetical protein
MSIGFLFGGKAQLCEETWEPFSNVADRDDFYAGEWAGLITRAKGMGVDVKFTTKGIVMKSGKSEGTFKDYRGGVKLAERFLDSL